MLTRAEKKFQDPKVYLKKDYFGKGVVVDQVEVEMLNNFGYFTSGSQAHLSMYLPYSVESRSWPRNISGDYGPIFGAPEIEQPTRPEELKQQIDGGYKFPFTDEYRWSIHAADVMIRWRR